jgi:fucose 4-O-acetylase-like acetyltransferase
MEAAIAVEQPRLRSSPRAGAAERNGGVDALRAAVTLLVVLHHTAITYGAIGGWYYKEIAPYASAGGQLLVLFCTVNQAWFMGLFFLLAGYYTPPALSHHGAIGFARSRLIRLGIPLAVYFLLLSPLTNALAATARGRPFTHAFIYIWTHGELEPGPLWFAEALLIFSALWLAWRSLAPAPRDGRERSFPSGAVLLAAAMATGSCCVWSGRLE